MFYPIQWHYCYKPCHSHLLIRFPLAAQNSICNTSYVVNLLLNGKGGGMNGWEKPAILGLLLELM
jgi:hypothetical protein